MAPNEKKGEFLNALLPIAKYSTLWKRWGTLCMSNTNYWYFCFTPNYLRSGLGQCLGWLWENMALLMTGQKKLGVNRIVSAEERPQPPHLTFCSVDS